MWVVYILRCSDRSLYTGVTTDIQRRLREHNAGTGGAYTCSKRPVRLVYYEDHSSRSSALKREADIKGLARCEKEALISSCGIMSPRKGIGRLQSMRHKSTRIVFWLILFFSVLNNQGWGEPMGEKLKKATFGAGCFWGVEKIYAKIPGVVSTTVGYMGGATHNPTYHEVCTNRTGHAEVVEVTYDPAKVSYEELLITFWEWHDPTTMNRQGPDVGSQYRSVIFYYDDNQAKTAQKSKQILEQSTIYPRPIVTQIVPAAQFYKAEEYHQQYLQKNPGGYCSHHMQSPTIRQVLKEKS